LPLSIKDGFDEGQTEFFKLDGLDLERDEVGDRPFSLNQVVQDMRNVQILSTSKNICLKSLYSNN